MTTQPEAPLGTHLADAVTEEELASTWRQVEARRRPPPRVGVGAWKWVWVASAAAVAVALGWWSRSPSSLTLPDGAPLLHLAPASSARLVDGSSIDTTAAGVVDVLENDEAHLALHLVQGAARFTVAPGARRWRVEAAGVSVEVVGTRFLMERLEQSVRVQVEEGSVVVRGASVPDGVRRLNQGQALEVQLGPPPRARAPTPEPARTETAPPPPAPRSPSVAPAAPRAALDEAPPTPAPEPAPFPPPSEVTPPEPSAASLLSTADAARRGGQRAEAVRVLTELVEQWPASAEAPLAAFTAAKVLTEMGEAAEARVWYQRALELSLPDPLAQAARAALDGGAPP